MQALLTRTLGAGFLAVLLLVPSCARNPVTGQRQLVLISEAQELAYGREAHPEILAEFGRTEDPALQSYINEVGQKLARISHRPELEWHFTVVDVPVVNAFALPGGYIYLTREILAYMNSEAEMAGVLGHEIGHVTARHAVTQLSRQQLFGLGLGVGSIVSPTFRQVSDFAQVGLGLLSLKYSRDDERQSDELGIQYMARVSYDPRELSGFFRVFEGMQEKTGQAVPDWLSSHPAPPDRIRATSREAEHTMTERGQHQWTVGGETHLRRIEGLVFGENPREGFTENGRFLHPDLRFQLRYPSNWQVQNSKRSVLFVQPGGQAALSLTFAQAPQGTTPAEQGRRVAQQPGVRMVAGGPTRIHGKDAFLGHYQLQDAGGSVLEALAAFIAHEGHLYQYAGLTLRGMFQRVSSTFEDSLRSFDDLRDSRALNVQPDRIRIHTAAAGETLGRLAERTNNPRVKADDLALLNRLEPDEALAAGTRVKLVEPGRR